MRKTFTLAKIRYTKSAAYYTYPYMWILAGLTAALGIATILLYRSH
jgi:hypothetical protein